MRTCILVFIAALTFQACSSPIKPKNERDSTKANVSDMIASNTSPITFKGLYTFGHEVNTFMDCSDGKKVYWVNDSLKSLRDQYKKTTGFLSYPYESVYAEVKGYLSGKSDLGFTSEYENVLVLTDILKVEAKNFRTECYDYEFIALGNEPFWSLDIISKERRIIFKNVGQERTLEFFYAPAASSEGVYRQTV